MRDICFLKFGNTVKTGNCLNIDNLMIGCSVGFCPACVSKFGYRFILIIL
jgi:hypothetical protein